MESEARLRINMGFGYAAVNDFLFETPVNEILNISGSNAYFRLLHLAFLDGFSRASNLVNKGGFDCCWLAVSRNGNPIIQSK